MHLSYFIAKRYLFAKKSHNVINIISLISAIGIAVGSCALILVLSVYNGFEDIVRRMYDKDAPDIVLSCRTDKYFSLNNEIFQAVGKLPRLSAFTATVEENVFLRYNGEEKVVLLKGVDGNYGEIESVRASVLSGEFRLKLGDIPHAVCGNLLSSDLRLMVNGVEPLEVYYPDKNKTVNPHNPTLTINSVSFFPSGTLSPGNEKYRQALFVSIDQARSLIGMAPDETGAVELRFLPGTDISGMQKKISGLLGNNFRVLNKYQQNETVYKMMRIEKTVIFLIMIFIVVIISCNVFGSLTMLIIEKKDDIRTLQHLGAGDGLIRKIFFNEGWMIILFGTLIGLATGIVLALIQQHVGILEMPGNFIVDYYPVIIRPEDILLTFAGIAVTGTVITALPTRKTLSRIL